MSHDDFAVEPVPGLPAKPPMGEAVLWQGRPQTWALARESLGLTWVAGWFVLLAVWRIVTVSSEVAFPAVLLTGLPLLALGLAACGIILLIALVQARSTVYTITTARVAMRIGAALTVTFNIPYTKVASANLDLKPSGTGTIALKTLGDSRLSYLVCWPHVRPWRMARTEPALRCIPQAAKVARILADAAETRVSQPEITRSAAHVSAAGVAAE